MVSAMLLIEKGSLGAPLTAKLKPFYFLSLICINNKGELFRFMQRLILLKIDLYYKFQNTE